MSNEKGGVGKTLLAVNVAAGLAQRGKRVLLLDGDPQGHATVSLGIEKYPGLFRFMVDDAPPQDVIYCINPKVYGCMSDVSPVINGAIMTDDEKRHAKLTAIAQASRLHILGSDAKTQAIPTLIADVWKLTERLQELSERYDVCIIDTSPSPSLFHGSIYFATELILFPTECEFLSGDGLGESLGRLMSMREKHHRQIRVAGIVPNKYRANTREHAENLAKLREIYGDLVWPEIPLSIAWGETAAYGLPIFVHAPDHAATLVLWEILDRVEEAINGKST